MVSVCQFQAQHAALRVEMLHLLDVASVDRGYRAAAQGLVRDLDGAINAHVAEEADHNYDALAADAEPLDRLAADWSGFAAAWSTQRIAADWPGFTSAVQAILPRMLTRIAHEDACLARQAA